MVSLWALGVVLALGTAVVDNIACNLQRFAYLRNDLKPIEQRNRFFKLPFWWLGVILLLCSNVMGSVALSFAPASVIVPLASIGLVCNALVSRFWLKEAFHIRDLAATIIVVAGAVLIVVFGSKEDAGFDIEQLMALYSAPRVIIYLSVMGAALVVLFGTCGLIELHIRGKVENERENFVKWLAFAYPLANGVLNGVAVIISKSFALVLRATVIDGENQFVFARTYAIVGAQAVSGICQFGIMNVMLRRYDSAYSIPVSYGASVSFAITGSALYFGDFDNNFGAVNFAMYFIGVAIIITGVIILSRRISSGELTTAHVEPTQTVIELQQTIVICEQDNDSIVTENPPSTHDSVLSSADEGAGTQVPEGEEPEITISTEAPTVEKHAPPEGINSVLPKNVIDALYASPLADALKASHQRPKTVYVVHSRTSFEKSPAIDSVTRMSQPIQVASPDKLLRAFSPAALALRKKQYASAGHIPLRPVPTAPTHKGHTEIVASTIEPSPPTVPTTSADAIVPTVVSQEQHGGDDEDGEAAPDAAAPAPLDNMTTVESPLFARSRSQQSRHSASLQKLAFASANASPLAMIVASAL
eukprot:TRINITY_DN11112_c0_g1_i1.p1 TRINITY_DN11112_c0_g1~~TRINITY_DN11112_c0_g1_i1.p1  ORF type:complete len:589 (-),score=114.11 TRINITY_DN11112_c0_g1_i1:147-1913(-)